MPYKDPQAQKEYKQQYYLINREKIAEREKRYRLANPEKIAAQRKQYRLVNCEEIAESKKQYYLANRKKFAARQVKYRLANPEKAAECEKRYRLANPEKKRDYQQRRRARERNLESTLTAAEWQKILDDHFGRCHYCGTKSDKLHQEHKIPVFSGGGYTAENIIPACKSCNSSKRNRGYKAFVEQTNDRLQEELF